MLNTNKEAPNTAGFRSKQSAIKALKQDRTTAKRHVQSMHTLASSKVKCTEFHGKIQEVLAFISQAETTKQVMNFIIVVFSLENSNFIVTVGLPLCCVLPLLISTTMYFRFLKH